MNESLADYTTSKGETWYPIEDDCPECGGEMWSNGRVKRCKGDEPLTEDSGCGYWEVIKDE